MAKSSNRYLALLRGINVGGNNIFSKDDLRTCFEDLGYENVRTYIQSGNILFRSNVSSSRELTAVVERGLSEKFAYDSQAVVIPLKKYQSMVEAAPDGWGINEKQKHNALFTLAGTTSRKVLSKIPTPNEKIESVSAGSGVVYWSVSKSSLTKSTFVKLPRSPVYKQLTIRNHNTVFRLLELLKEI